MEWINVIVAAVCGLGGAFGGSTLLYFRQNRKQKDIDNELKEAEAWERMYHEVLAQCKEKDTKIDELRRDVNNLRESKIFLVEENAKEVQRLQAEKAELEIKLVECNWYRCERCGCGSRKPKREIDIQAEGGGYEN